MKRSATPVYLVFLVMGFGDLIGPLVSLVKQNLQTSQFEASLLAFAGFIMFGILSIPVGVLQANVGKKPIAFGGLFLVLAGVTTPLIGLESFAGYLTAVLLLGAGVTVLQVAGGPLLQEVSPAGSFARKLTFGQFIKGIGALSAPLIPILAYRYFDNRWQLVFPIFAAGTVAAIIAMFFHSSKVETQNAATLRACFALLRDTRIALLVLAIFVYVGAEVCMSSMLPAILEKQYGYRLADFGMAGTGIFFLTLMAGRFLGTLVLTRLRPANFFLLSCILALAGLSLLATGSGSLGFVAAALIGIGFANLFPLVYAIAIEALPEKANEVSGLMVTAICGGAIIPPVMGYMSERTSLIVALVVPAACLLYLTGIALAERKPHASPL
jgi:FHS family L-fucose permease-like MFS transporter